MQWLERSQQHHVQNLAAAVPPDGVLKDSILFGGARGGGLQSPNVIYFLSQNLISAPFQSHIFF
jgi:hypothetical protein